MDIVKATMEGVCVICKNPVDKHCWLPVCTNHAKEFAHYIANEHNKVQ